MKSETAHKTIPATACFLAAGEFTVTRKNETDKSGALRMLARTGQPIEHWFWGRIVHDLAGMRLHKRRLPVDYVHDPKEIIGYLNHFGSESGDLVATGALVPFKDSDRATEIMHKQAAGVPYEASINFGGDGIAIEELAEGESAQVNGYTFDGPGVIVREWPLRGVAICPYGADQNTESALFAGCKETTFAATVITAPDANEENAMSDNAKSDEVAAAAEPTPDVSEEFAAEAAVEASAAEGAEAQPVEANEAPAEELAAEEKQDQPEPEPVSPAPDPVAEFKRMKSDFGAEIAAEVFEQGGDYAQAQKLAYERARAENAKLREQLAQVTPSGGTPAEFSAARENGVDSNGVAKVFRVGTRRGGK